MSEWCCWPGGVSLPLWWDICKVAKGSISISIELGLIWDTKQDITPLHEASLYCFSDWNSKKAGERGCFA